MPAAANKRPQRNTLIPAAANTRPPTEHAGDALVRKGKYRRAAPPARRPVSRDVLPRAPLHLRPRLADAQFRAARAFPSKMVVIIDMTKAT
jgi:hypothetical protein